MLGDEILDKLRFDSGFIVDNHCCGVGAVGCKVRLTELLDLQTNVVAVLDVKVDRPGCQEDCLERSVNLGDHEKYSLQGKRVGLADCIAVVRTTIRDCQNEWGRETRDGVSSLEDRTELMKVGVKVGK